METLYKFRDWTSISRMKNSSKVCDNCHLRIDVGVIFDNEEIEGYQVTVYHEISRVTVYRFYVEYGKPNVWSLTYEEAVEVLNKIGFSCQYERQRYDLTDKMKNTLKSFKDLGYTHIWRTTDFRVLVSGSDVSRPHEVKHLVEKLNYKYNYHNFTYLDFIPATIEGILEDSERE